jgi:hypothetical protein
MRSSRSGVSEEHLMGPMSVYRVYPTGCTTENYCWATMRTLVSNYWNTLVRNTGREVTRWNTGCATMASDRISARITWGETMPGATVTYVMWREEHLWDVSVLQRANISNPVNFLYYFYMKSLWFATIFTKATIKSCLQSTPSHPIPLWSVSNTILQFTLRFPKRDQPLGFSSQYVACISLFPLCIIWPVHHIGSTSIH